METEEHAQALSWIEARRRLRCTLENYLKEEPPKLIPPNQATTTIARPSFLTVWIQYDLDLYVGSLLLSVALLVITSLSWLAKTGGLNQSALNPQASLVVYKAQVAAAVLLVAGALLSLLMVRSRRELWMNDNENAKRRTIRSFLRKLDQDADKKNPGRCQIENTMDLDPLNLHGTSLTDCYPVFRISQSSNKEVTAWSRVPSLLLVKGDIIALQIGDQAPADCRLAGRDNAVPLYRAGELIKTSSIQQDTTMSMLPTGRSTLPNGSPLFLPLCNGMRIFVVTETPLETFLRRPKAMLKPSEASRQLSEIRKLLSCMALVFLLLTAIIVFVRSGTKGGDLSLNLPLPILATLSVVPVVGPAFVVITEMLGTARILATVHKYAAPSVVRDDLHGTQTRSGLLWRYILATLLSRLSLWQLFISFNDFLSRFFSIRFEREGMIRVPPVSQCLLEKLGVATCFSVVDDQIVCEPHAIPQQLVIPSANGLKLLDLCMAHDEESDQDSDDSHSSSSDSSDNEVPFLSLRRNKALRRASVKKHKTQKSSVNSDDQTESTGSSSYEVQFEDPGWWQFLPTLKGIGLCSLVVDENKKDTSLDSLDGANPCEKQRDLFAAAAEMLVPFVCRERRSNQLRALAQCIGFSVEPNSSGDRGDMSPFTEQRRLHIVSGALVKERLEIDAHERSSEQSRWWGYVRPDATSVVVQDNRSKAYQILTVGDPKVVTGLCYEAWQGEISTILPLTPGDRQTILETANDWKLGDLDVAAFAYSPIPRTVESLIDQDNLGHDSYYLFDGTSDVSASQRSKGTSQEWSLLKNQVFLGVLGSLVVPRDGVQKLLKALGDAGVRFVYFSPRNMRRQKELAIQLSIDVSWNAAISLRPLESGEEDPHRMTSAYADWDVNARLPHGIDDVKKHLEDVDNVPLLVSLFTDVTKQTTREMIDIFQEYCDTVIAVGSTIPLNDSIFSIADIAVGVDLFNDGCKQGTVDLPQVLASELEFVSGVSAHSCAFRFRRASTVSHMCDIMRQGRAALAASTAACLFLVSGCLTFSFFVLLLVCNPSTTIPFVATLGAVLYLQLVLPLIGLALCMTDGEIDTMKHVPPKNDQSVTFRRREGKLLYMMLIAKAIPPALLSTIMWLLAIGQLVFELEPEFVLSECAQVERWAQILRCDALQAYWGPAKSSAGVLSLSHLVICISLSSASFVYRFCSVIEQSPTACNRLWLASVVLIICLTIIYAATTVATGSAGALSWYFYLLFTINPILCLLWNEYCKSIETKAERRAEKIRRLQFETRLGAYSPK